MTTDSQPIYCQWPAGTRVRTRFSAERTVIAQRGCMVWLGDGTWHHPNTLRLATTAEATLAVGPI